LGIRRKGESLESFRVRVRGLNPPKIFLPSPLINMQRGSPTIRLSGVRGSL